MKKELVVYIFTLLSTATGLAQNLVPNGDFNISGCPTKLGELDKAVGWYSLTINTTDHYHRCGGKNVKIGTNKIGYQMPAKGDGYAGFVRAYIYVNTNRDTLYNQTREYLQCQLSSSIEKGARYSVSIRVSMAEISFYTVNIIGILFSENSITDYSRDSYLPLYLNPQTEFNQSLTDTVNWLLLANTIDVDWNLDYMSITPIFDKLIK